MDARILSEADLQKLVHCEIVGVEQSVVEGVICITLMLRSYDETLFHLSLIPGVAITHFAGQTLYKPGLNLITKEFLVEGSKE